MYRVDGSRSRIRRGFDGDVESLVVFRGVRGLDIGMGLRREWKRGFRGVEGLEGG